MSATLEYNICEECNSRVDETDEYDGKQVCADCFADLEDFEVNHRRKHGRDYEPDREEE